MKILSPTMTGSAAFTPQEVFQGCSQSSWPSSGFTAESALMEKSSTARVGPSLKGIGEEYPADSLPEAQTTLPVALSNAVPAGPALMMSSFPSTSGEPEKPQLGILRPSSS